MNRSGSGSSFTESMVDGRIVRGTLLVIIACALALRFYHLGVPSLWLDEMWTAMVSSKSVPCIVDIAKYYDLHPPLSRLLFKFILLFGRDDFSVRFLYALSGASTVYVLFMIGRRFLGQITGLFAASYLALSYAHIWMSRTINIYPLYILVFALLFFFMLRYLNGRNRKDYWYVTVSCALLANAHLVGICLAFATYLMLSFDLLVRKEAPRAKLTALLKHSVIFLALAAPTLYFFYMQSTHSAFNASYAIWDNWKSMFGLPLDALRELTYFFRDLPMANAVFVAVALGFLRLLATTPRAALLIAVYYVIPVAILSAATWWSIEYRYIGHLTVLMALCFGSFVSMLIPRMAPAANKNAACVLLAVAMPVFAGLLLVRNMPWLYVDGNLETVREAKFGTYKQIAKSLIRDYPGGLVSIDDEARLAGGLAWYVGQLSPENFISSPVVDDSRQQATYSLIMQKTDDNIRELKAFAQSHPGYAVEVKDRYAVLWTRVETEPLVVREPVNTLEVRALPHSIMRYAHQLRNVKLDPRSEWLTPTSYEAGQVDLRIRNEIPSIKSVVYFTLEYRNMAKHGRIIVRYALDNGEYATLLPIDGKGERALFSAEIPADKHFDILKVQFQLFADPDTAVDGVENFSLVGIKSIRLNIADAEHADINFTNVLAQTMPQGKLADMAPGQTVTGQDTLSLHHEGDAEILTVHADATDGWMAVHLENAKDPLYFYPRVSGNRDTVTLYAVEGESKRRLFFMRGNGVNWTPIKMKVRLPVLNPKEDLLISLSGGAQLWTREGKPVFAD